MGERARNGRGPEQSPKLRERKLACRFQISVAATRGESEVRGIFLVVIPAEAGIQ